MMNSHITLTIEQEDEVLVVVLERMRSIFQAEDFTEEDKDELLEAVNTLIDYCTVPEKSDG